MIRNSSSPQHGQLSTRARFASGLLLFLLLLVSCGAAGTSDKARAIPVTPDYPAATWTPAAKTSFGPANRPKGFRSNDSITYVIVHAADGSAASAIKRFQNPPSRVSAHYLISHDGRVTQLIREKDIA